MNRIQSSGYLVFLIIVFLAVCPCAAQSPVASPESLLQAIAAEKDAGRKAVLYKQLGDYWADRQAYDKAAKDYRLAVSTNRKSFTASELLDMAFFMTWGDDAQGAEIVLRGVLADDPANIKARTQLARALIYKDALDEAEKEADLVLATEPSNRDALLVKADALRFKGESGKAAAHYQLILKKNDDFEARIGLTRAHLDAAELAEAKQSFVLLKPSTPEQNAEWAKLRDAISEAERGSAPVAAGVRVNPLMEPGNRFIEMGDHRAAALEYLKVLDSTSAFTAQEQLWMSTVLTWAGNLPEARKRLTKLVAENPSLMNARIQLARVLMWSGETDAAMKEIDTVLAAEPDNRDALLVRANIYRVTRNYRPSVELYSDIIKKQADYDSQEGLAYAYLFSNDRVATDKTLPQLQPVYPYQEKGLRDLKELRDINFNPSIIPGFTFYHDSDNNDVWRYLATGTVWLENWKTSVDYVHTEARDPNISQSSDTVALSTYSRMPFYGGIGGAIGLADSGRTLIYGLRGDVDIPSGSVGARAAVDALTDTAKAMQNQIRVFSAALAANHRPTDRIYLFGSYTYKDYSDDNSANDVTAGISYRVLHQPAAVAIGYRARYLNYRRQSNDGYFDPSNYMSHVGFANVYFESGRLYGFLEGYGGYQSFTQNEEGYNNFIGGGSASIGYRFSKHFALEASAEGGNHAVGASGAWNYYLLGMRLICTF